MEIMVYPFAVVLLAFLLSNFHQSFVSGAAKSEVSYNEQLLDLLVSQNQRFELLESRNRELQATIERQTNQIGHMASTLQEFQETVTKQRQQLDGIYKILDENANDKRTETHINDNTDQKSKNSLLV